LFDQFNVYIHTYINKTEVVSKSLTIKHVYDILVSTALVKRAGNYITFPKEPKLSEIKGNFYSVANFPGVTLSYLVSRLDS
jgi:hypothetical protein